MGSDPLAGSPPICLLASRGTNEEYPTVTTRILWLAAFGLVSVSCAKDADPGACFVARHVADCCSMPVAVTQRDLDSDPCLQLWDRAVDVGACPAASQCNLQTCEPTLALAPWTRIAIRSGSSCVFQSECDTDADCMPALNRSYCCACPQWVPRQLLSTDACYVSEGQVASSECESCADVLDCDTCPTAPNGSCVQEANFRKCL